MIAQIEGRLVKALPTQIIVDVGGIGFQLTIPLSSYNKLPPIGNPVQLLTHLTIREDSVNLYGFATQEERDLFLLLVQRIPNVGPKTALNILSGMSVEEFRTAVISADVTRLSKIHGVGKKTAERIILELKDHLPEATNAPSQPISNPFASDAILALVSLGFRQSDASQAVRSAILAGHSSSAEELVRHALKSLS
ncbi:MAG: Holliday junction branch migration protein RuvA [Chthoniobacterales bacterium]|nr:Holliday junction branch migration protein RuvA [Chthoniobacterales bacterium]